MYIYLIVNHITGKYYVGQHKGNNLRQYLQKKFYDASHGRGGSSYLYASMRKHGREAFTIHALLSDVQTRPELDQHERDFIVFLKSKDPDYGYNICKGGEGYTGPFTEAMKAAWSAGNQRYWDKHKYDLTGQTFGKLTVLSETESRKNKHSGWKAKRMWNCQCECGNFSGVATNALRSGSIKSCGCLIAEAGRKRWAKQAMVGKVFSGLTVQSEAGHYRSQRQWNCLCTCGNRTVVRTNSLRSGNSKSCGCGSSLNDQEENYTEAKVLGDGDTYEEAWADAVRRLP